MAIYRAREWGQIPSPLGPKRIEEGEQFSWDGPPGRWMEPVDEAARKAVVARFGEDAVGEEPPIDVYDQHRVAKSAQVAAELAGAVQTSPAEAALLKQGEEEAAAVARTAPKRRAAS